MSMTYGQQILVYGHEVGQTVSQIAEGFQAFKAKARLVGELSTLKAHQDALTPRISEPDEVSMLMRVDGFRRMVLAWVRDGMNDGPELHCLGEAARILNMHWYQEVGFRFEAEAQAASARSRARMERRAGP